MQLGINLLGIERTHPGVPYSNLLIPIGDWGDGSGPPTPLASLTPPGDATAVGSTPAIAATTHPATVGYAIAGTYTVLADGVGSLYYGGAFDFTGAPGQSHSITLTGTGETQIFVTAVGSPPLSNLRLIGPLGSDSSFFTPTYLESLRGFSVLRAFDPMIGQGATVDPYNPPDPLTVDVQTNLATSVVTWDQADLRPGRGPRGLCELITALKKVNGVAPDLWINLPLLCAAMTANGTAVATDYARGLGAYLARHLPAGVQVYVEYIDEPWGFTGYDQYLVAQGNGLGLPRYAIYGALSGAVWAAFEAGFGGNCIRILNGQNVFPEGNLVDALDYLQAHSIRVDVISPAPYWWVFPEDTTVSGPIKAAWAAGDHAGALTQFFAALNAGITAAVSHLANWKSIATAYGTRLSCYEGGLSDDLPYGSDPDLIAMVAAAYVDARIGPAIASYLAAVGTYADLFCWYNHIGLGSWGAMEDLADCGSRRMTALRASMGLPPMVLGDPSYPGDGYGSTGAGLVLSGPTPPTPPPTTATASFLAADTATQGSWIGVYGSQGYSVAGTTPAMPANSAVVLAQTFTYAGSTSDVRAPQLPGGSGRIAAVWYMGQVFNVDLDLTGTGPRDVALYCLDWDAAGRSLRVQVMDAASREILDTRSVSSFSGGTYLTYRISGHVLIQVACQAGTNTVLSGVFLDPATGGSGPVRPTITWPSPSPIVYGTPLSATQLDATANAAGAFVYTPPAGTVLAAGTQTLSVAFTPTDTATYSNASATTTLTVTRATPTITWPNLSPIAQGTPLGATQLNATAAVAGTFAYAPAAGTVLPTGNQTLAVTFAPTNSANYTTAAATNNLSVLSPGSLAVTIDYRNIRIVIGAEIVGSAAQVAAQQAAAGAPTPEDPAGETIDFSVVRLAGL